MSHPQESPLMAVILAAGKGTRMNSKIPKVLHTLGGKQLIKHALSQAGEISADRILVVLGHRADLVEAAVKDLENCEIVIQEPQLGTGHALLQCLDLIRGFSGTVLVLSGDVPLLSRKNLEDLLKEHRKSSAAVTVMTSILGDPEGYGRIIRDGSGRAVAIREQRDLTEGQEKINEGNMGVYAFESRFLTEELPRLGNDNAQGEYYLTDLVLAASETGKTVSTCVIEDPAQAMGINTLAQLAAMEVVMKKEILAKLMDSGVRIIDPETTYVDETVRIESDVILHPMTFLYGKTRVGSGSVIHPGAVIKDSIIGPEVEVKPYSVIEKSIIDTGAVVGPFAHLRPETRLMEGSKIGNFVEVKKSTIGKGSKASHLTYIGDSQLGEGVNVGAGTVTCNYDGFSKHKTVLGDGVFIGSGTMLVAPVQVGKGAITAAGSTITSDLPPDSLGIARSKQTVKDDWAPKFRERAVKEREKS